MLVSMCLRCVFSPENSLEKLFYAEHISRNILFGALKQPKNVFKKLEEGKRKYLSLLLPHFLLHLSTDALDGIFAGVSQFSLKFCHSKFGFKVQAILFSFPHISFILISELFPKNFLSLFHSQKIKGFAVTGENIKFSLLFFIKNKPNP